ncbi:MAG: ComEC/Rec2 family competence protein [Crocinitomicaceae bacterium]
MLFPLIVGVIIQFHFAFSVSVNVVLTALILLVSLAVPIASKWPFVSRLYVPASVITFYLIGGYLGSLNDSRLHPKYFWDEASAEASNFACKIVEPPEEKVNSIKAVVQVFQRNDQAVTGKTLLYFQKDSAANNLRYGDVLYFTGRFNQISQNNNPKEFNYRRYLRIHDIHHQLYLKSENWSWQRNEGNSLVKSIFDLRHYLSEVIQESGMNDKNVMVANALLLGQKELLDKEVLRSYSSAGAMHVLAVSGLHVGIIMLILNFIFSPIKKRRAGKWLFLSLVVGGIWFYAIITGLSPSVLRAAVMFSFIVFGKELQRETNIYQSLMFSAFVLILIEPYIIFQVGFQLSYLAVLGIVYLQPKISNWFYFSNTVLDKAWQITAVSLAAQTATFPLGLYYFHQFPNFFMLSNLIVIPLAFVLLIVGVTYLVLHFVPIVSHLLLLVFDSLLSLLNLGVEWVERLPYSILWGISIEWFEVVAIYITMLLAVIGIRKRSFQLIASSSVLTVLLLLFNILEKTQISNENKVFIYNIKDELAVDVFYGMENRFYASKTLMQDESKLLFHVKHNWFYRSGQEQPTEYEEIQYLKTLKCGEHNFVFADTVLGQPLIADFSSIDYLVIHDVSYVHSENVKIFQEFSLNLIVLPSVKYKVVNYLKSNLESSRVYDVKESGCFELTF